MVNPKVIDYAYPQAIPITDYVCETIDDTVRISFWNTQKLGQQPTEEELASIEASGAFQNWLRERGGDATLTLRRSAKEALSSSTNIVLRAALALLLDEINILRAQHSLAARTMNQFRTAILNKIDSGAGD